MSDSAASGSPAVPRSSDPAVLPQPTLPAEPRRPDDPSTRAAIEIDHRCDDFESRYRRGDAPRIEDAIASTPEAVRKGLLLELVALEINLLMSGGVVRSPLDYVDRFPQFAAELRELVVNPEAVFLSDSQAAAPEDHTFEGTVPQCGLIKHFQLQEILGQGGNGVVWRALDLKLQRLVAIKLPRPDKAGTGNFAAMLREARAAAALRHSNIVPVYEVGEGTDVSSCFIATGLVEGPSLKTWLVNNKPSPDQAAATLIKVCGALSHAHNRKIIHRDIKPGNILVDAAGEPYLADFGLAKALSLEESISQEGFLIGTPLYMSPEQARGDHDAVDHRADIYSAGVLLYVMLVGKPPFGGDLPRLLQQIRDVAPPAPSHLNKAVPADLEQICLKCLAKEPAQRYQSADDLADDLNRFLLGESIRGVPVPLPQRVRKWAWRNRLPILRTTLAVLATAAVALGVILWLFPRQPREKVVVETIPPGCRITTVMLDPATGEPDPTRLQTASGVTPLTVSLPPGDYLVVAVLDDHRFHEVFRHVPGKGEDVPFLGPHRHWKRGERNRLVWGTIAIPRADLTLSMGFVEGVEAWLPPKMPTPGKRSARKISSFYFDLAEIPAKTGRKNVSGSAATKSSEPSSEGRNFDQFVQELEQAGKRPPSFDEMFYLQTAFAKLDPAIPSGAIQLPAGKKVEGLFSPPFEWIWGVIDVPTTGLVSMKRIGAGEAVTSQTDAVTTPRIRIRMAPESALYIAENNNTNVITGRGVRSHRPRTRPEDY